MHFENFFFSVELGLTSLSPTPPKVWKILPFGKLFPLLTLCIWFGDVDHMFVRLNKSLCDFLFSVHMFCIRVTIFCILAFLCYGYMYNIIMLVEITYRLPTRNNLLTVKLL